MNDTSPTFDGISAWIQFLRNYDNNGCNEVKLNELDNKLKEEYYPGFHGGIIAFIDRLQANMSELTSLEPNSIADHRKKRMLLATLQNVSKIDFLMQTCRDQVGWDYHLTASYLRSNVFFSDHSNSKNTNSMLAATSQNHELNLKEVQNMFEDAAKETNFFLAYTSFSNSYIRRQLNIPEAIWLSLIHI